MVITEAREGVFNALTGLCPLDEALVTACFVAQFADLVEGVWREHALTLDARKLRLVFSAHLCIPYNYLLSIRDRVSVHLKR